MIWIDFKLIEVFKYIREHNYLSSLLYSEFKFHVGMNIPKT